MAVNKVNFGDNTLIDLTNDTVDEEAVLEGETFHSKSGEQKTGKVVVPKEKEIKWEDFLALPDEEKNNGTTYYITDYPGLVFNAEMIKYGNSNVKEALDKNVSDISTLNSTISNKNSLKYEKDNSSSLFQLIGNTPINTVKTYYIEHTNQFTDWNTKKTYLDYASVTIYRFNVAVCNVVMVGYGISTFKCEILKTICINNNFYWGD